MIKNIPTRFLCAGLCLCLCLIPGCGKRGGASGGDGDPSAGLSSAAGLPTYESGAYTDGSSGDPTVESGGAQTGGARPGSTTGKRTSPSTGSTRPPDKPGNVTELPDEVIEDPNYQIKETTDHENDAVSLTSTTYNTNYHNRYFYNYNDYLDSDRHIRFRHNVDWSSDAATGNRINKTGFLRLKDQKDNMVIYQAPSDIMGFAVQVAAPRKPDGDFKVYLSANGKDYYRIACIAESAGTTTGGLNLYNIKNKHMLGKSVIYLKIVYQTAGDYYVCGVFMDTYNRSDTAANLLHPMSTGVKAASAGYTLNGKAGELVLYKTAMKGARFTVKYKGATPTLSLTYSADGDYWMKVGLHETEKTTKDGYTIADYVPADYFYQNTKMLRLTISKSDGNGTNFQIPLVSLCEEGFADVFADSLNLTYAFDATAKVASAGTMTGGHVVYNKNDISAFHISATGTATPRVQASSDGQSFSDVAVTAADRNKTSFRLHNKAALPKNSNFLRIYTNGAAITGVAIDGVNDTVEEMKKILARKGKSFQDVFSISHVRSNYGYSSKDILTEGMDAIAALGGRSVNLWMTRKPGDYYARNSSWGSYGTLVDVAKSPIYKAAFDRSDFDRYVLYLETENQPGNMKSGISDSTLQKEYDNTYRIADYLFKTYKGTGKTFIFQTWETDWWIVDNPTDRNYSSTGFDTLVKWNNKRQEAVTAARQANADSNVKIYYCLEFVNATDALAGKKTVLTEVVPQTSCDMYAYSAYDTHHSRHSFEAALKLIKEKAKPSAALGRNNLYVGEYGCPEKFSNFGVSFTYHNTVNTIKTYANNDFLFGNYWQLYDNEEAGYWLIRDKKAQKLQAYYLFEYLLKRS